MKRCSTSLVFREMKIETTMRYHFTLLRMAIIKKIYNAGEAMEKRELTYTDVGNVNPYSLYGEQVSKKTKNRTSVRSSSPIPRHIPGENQNSKRYTAQWSLQHYLQ